MQSFNERVVWCKSNQAPALGAGGRRFESCHPDVQEDNYKNVVVFFLFV